MILHYRHGLSVGRKRTIQPPWHQWTAANHRCNIGPYAGATVFSTRGPATVAAADDRQSDAVTVAERVTPAAGALVRSAGYSTRSPTVLPTRPRLPVRQWDAEPDLDRGGEPDMCALRTRSTREVPWYRDRMRTAAAAVDSEKRNGTIRVQAAARIGPWSFGLSLFHHRHSFRRFTPFYT